MTVTEIWLGVPCTEAAQSAMMDKGYQLQPHTHGAHRRRYVMAVRPAYYKRIDACVGAAARVFKLRREHLLGRSRCRPLAYARWSAMSAAFELGYSYSQIGREMNRDHTSVMYGLQQCLNIQERDADYRISCERVMSMVRSA